MTPKPADSHYRADIDGLRAIAVLSVIAYHLGLAGAGSGYAGVDVFFVISGFLIGGIVLRERAEGSFTYRRFYARRARRILPALCAVILVTIPFAWSVMTPYQLRYFGGAIFSTMLFASNIWFYNRIDYFNPDVELDPLLHTWSLAVEEQFYLIFPPLVALAAWMGKRAVLPVLAGIGLISLIFTLASSADHPTLSFYMLHTRLWEMMAGVLAAGLMLRASKVPDRAAAILAALGLALVICGVTILPPVTGWPGPTTLIPVTGATLLVLFGGRPGAARSLLASLPFRAVGLISYSAYLVHHPLITLLHLYEMPPVSLWAKLGVILLTLALAGLSWALVEQPFRRRGALPSLGRWGLSAAVLALMVFAIGGHITKGYPSRLPIEAQAVLKFHDSRSPVTEDCTMSRDDVPKWKPDNACLHNAEAKGPQIALWGDSHATGAAYLIAQAMPELPMYEFSIGGCPSIPGMMNIDQLTDAKVEYAEGCADFNVAVRDWLLAHDEVKLVLMYSYWSNYIEREDFDTRTGYVLPDVQFGVPVGDDGSIDEAERQAYLQRQFAALVDELTKAGKKVLIIDPLPIAAFDLPPYLARRIWKEGGIPEVISYPEAAFRDYTKYSRAVLDTVPEGPLVQRLDLTQHFCGDGICRLYENDTAYYFDTNHLSQEGIARIAPDIAAGVRKMLAAP